MDMIKEEKKLNKLLNMGMRLCLWMKQNNSQSCIKYDADQCSRFKHGWEGRIENKWQETRSYFHDENDEDHNEKTKVENTY